MKLTGWGRYPVIQAKPIFYYDIPSLASEIRVTSNLIAFGNGRSYGDSALAERYVPVRSKHRILSFDQDTGLLTCESGVLLSEIVETFLPRGWFLKVTPGTKLITVGGAIAADVHGKNHHHQGCFGDTVESFQLMMADGTVLNCSRSENAELFMATCGGMGLTGIILQASFYLKKVFSQTIEQLTIKTRNLEAVFEAFEKYSSSPYSVAWIDCLASKYNLGRSLLMVGDFIRDGNLNYQPGKRMSIPFDFPSFALNYRSVKAFNKFYYSRVKNTVSTQKVTLDSFFYPLDAIDQWNRIYGRKGFIQYQFILPKADSYKGLTKILEKISASGMASFLAVLKLYGPANDNYLSFPLEGYSLALDFKIQPGLLTFLNELDKVVLKYQGRIYLAKDARVSRETFEQGYPNIEKFRSLRNSLGLDKKFSSLQSIRLGI